MSINRLFKLFTHCCAFIRILLTFKFFSFHHEASCLVVVVIEWSSSTTMLKSFLHRRQLTVKYFLNENLCLSTLNDRKTDTKTSYSVMNGKNILSEICKVADKYQNRSESLKSRYVKIN